MASPARVEYVGVTAQGNIREYALRAWQVTGSFRSFVVTIPNEAFLDHRVRYQDAPEICYLKVQREVLACADGPAISKVKVTEEDLDEYRAAHAPKVPKRRLPKPTQEQ